MNDDLNTVATATEADEFMKKVFLLVDDATRENNTTESSISRRKTL